MIVAPRGCDSIRKNLAKTGVLNKPEKSRNKIAAPKGYDSIRKHLAVCVMNT